MRYRLAEVTELEEQWQPILEFPTYSISNQGRVFNHRTNRVMRTSRNNFGHMKISLVDEYGYRRDQSVAKLVAEAFVDAPNLLCDQVVVLDGDFTNLFAENLAWRPKWFAWRFTRQLKVKQPNHYYNLPVFNLETGETYDSIVEAGMREGLLFDDIWRSTYSGSPCFPQSYVFTVVERV